MAGQQWQRQLAKPTHQDGRTDGPPTELATLESVSLTGSFASSLRLRSTFTDRRRQQSCAGRFFLETCRWTGDDSVPAFDWSVKVKVMRPCALKSCHITPILRSRHWLRITERIEYKLVSLTYKVLHKLISIQRPRSTRSLNLVCSPSLLPLLIHHSVYP